jgi:hypothetical protein
MPQRKTRSPAQIIKAIILVVALILLINYIVTHRADFGAITGIQLKYILPVLLLSGINLLLSCMRFRMMMTHLAHRIPFLTVLKHFAHGRFLNRFLPMGGSVYRAIMFKKTDGVSYKNYVAINLSFDWLNILCSSLLGILVLAIYDPGLSLRSVPLLPLFGAVLLLLIVSLPMAAAGIRMAGRVFSSPAILKRCEEASEIVAGVRRVLKNRAIFLSNSVIITLIIAGTLASYHLLFKSIGVDTDPVVLLVYLIILRFFRIIRITPANLGIREFLLGFMTHTLGTGAAEGVLVSLLMRLVTILVQGALSLGFVAAAGIKKLLRKDLVDG